MCLCAKIKGEREGVGYMSVGDLFAVSVKF